MNGANMCALNKDDFCIKAPVFVGDILWEHLQLLQAECDKEERSTLKNAAPKLSETAVAQLPVSAPKSYTPYSPPRNYTNLDSNKVYSSPMKASVNSSNTFYPPTTAADYRIDQRYYHPAAPAEINLRPSPPPQSSPSPPIKTEYSNPYNSYPYTNSLQYPPSRLYQYGYPQAYPSPPVSHPAAHQSPYFVPPTSHLSVASQHNQFESIDHQVKIIFIILDLKI